VSTPALTSPGRESDIAVCLTCTCLDAQVLIIDEISMVSGEMFNELEVMARRIMGNPAPFGGVQLVLSGDYFQCARDLY